MDTQYQLAHCLGSSNFLLWLMLLSLSTSIQTIWFLFNPWMAYSGKHPMAVIAMSDPPGLTQRSVFNFLAIFLTPSAKCAWNSSHTYMEHLWNCASGRDPISFAARVWQDHCGSSPLDMSMLSLKQSFSPHHLKQIIEKTMSSFGFILLARQDAGSFLFLLMRVVLKFRVKTRSCVYFIHVCKAHKFMLILSDAGYCQLR